MTKSKSNVGIKAENVLWEEISIAKNLKKVK